MTKKESSRFEIFERRLATYVNVGEGFLSDIVICDDTKVHDFMLPIKLSKK